MTIQSVTKCTDYSLYLYRRNILRKLCTRERCTTPLKLYHNSTVFAMPFHAYLTYFNEVVSVLNYDALKVSLNSTAHDDSVVQHTEYHSN